MIREKTGKPDQMSGIDSPETATVDDKGLLDDEPIVLYNKRVIAMIAPKEDYKTITFQPYMLTKCGRELYNIICSSESFEADADYNICCLKELQALYPGADFHIRMI